MFSASKTAAPSGYNLQRSVRLRRSASASFTRTVSVAGNRRTWTWSAWVKRGQLGASQTLFDAYSGNENNDTQVYITSGDNLAFSNVISGSQANGFFAQTNAVLRDPSSWYHLVFSVDTTQSTAVAALKVYVNGVQQTFSSTTYGGGTNQNTWVNSATTHIIGQTSPANSAYFDGYLEEINFIDGQALTPTSFGAYNATTGVWQPIRYAGTYGTNGFYLNFQDNSGATATTIGKDSSGNGNNWTPNNISVTAGVTYDSMTDVPTLTSATNANFCVLNPLAASTATTPTQGNLYLGNNAVNNFGCVATMGVSSGKWYWEVKPDSGFVGIGVTPLSFLPANIWPGAATSQALAYYSANGQKYNNGTNSAYGATFSSADLMGIALDMDAGTITFYKNNVSQGTAFTGLSGTYFPVIGGPNVYNSGFVNFGQQPFTYTPPTGFNRLNTYNLATPTVPNGAAQFAATLYTGTGATRTVTNTVNGTSFQPDFVWVKGRSGVTDHALYDSVRGTTKQLESNTTTAETTEATGLTAFGSTGFTVGALAQMNTNTATYVAWQWKASNTTAVTNTSGSITSSVSANPSAGFSIVTYTGTGVAATVGHGLNVAPRMIIVKTRTGTAREWVVGHSSLSGGWNDFILLSNTAAKQTGITAWNNTAPTSSVFSLGTGAGVNESTILHVAYCFSEIAGFSKFGSYTGNGSTDGPFVYTGFRPRWVCVKRSDGVGGWTILDSSRDTYNVAGNYLFSETSAAEGSTPLEDFLSNGFKLRATSSSVNSVGTYIYFAFAENPFNYSLAR